MHGVTFKTGVGTGTTTCDVIFKSSAGGAEFTLYTIDLPENTSSTWNAERKNDGMGVLIFRMTDTDARDKWMRASVSQP